MLDAEKAEVANEGDATEDAETKVANVDAVKEVAKEAANEVDIVDAAKDAANAG